MKKQDQDNSLPPLLSLYRFVHEFPDPDPDDTAQEKKAKELYRDHPLRFLTSLEKMERTQQSKEIAILKSKGTSQVEEARATVKDSVRTERVADAGSRAAIEALQAFLEEEARKAQT